MLIRLLPIGTIACVGALTLETLPKAIGVSVDRWQFLEPNAEHPIGDGATPRMPFTRCAALTVASAEAVADAGDFDERGSHGVVRLAKGLVGMPEGVKLPMQRADADAPMLKVIAENARAFDFR